MKPRFPLPGEQPMSKVYVIHENSVWVEPLRAAFGELGTPFEEWFLDRGVLDLRSPPPDGVFYNRMSASSHTRDHRYAAEYTGAVLAWLERHGRLVVNDSRALRLEISKVAQYEALGAFGIPTPDTLAVVGKENIVATAERLGFPAHPQAQPRRKGPRRPPVLEPPGARRASRVLRFRGPDRRHHAGPALHRGAGAVHHASRVRRRPLPLRGQGRHEPGLRALPGGRLRGRCALDRIRLLPGARAGREVPGRRTLSKPADPDL